MRNQTHETIKVDNQLNIKTASHSGHQVTPGATLTIKGSNLGSAPCQTKVTLGPGSCEVTAAKEDVLSCVLREVSDMVSLVPTPVTVVVSGR